MERFISLIYRLIYFFMIMSICAQCNIIIFTEADGRKIVTSFKKKYSFTTKLYVNYSVDESNH
jgi:hypothetical protein